MKKKLGSWVDDPCFYVDAVDGTRVALLVGPFRTLEEAEAVKEKAVRFAVDQSGDPKAVFYAYGCCKWPNGYKDGILNKEITGREL